MQRLVTQFLSIFFLLVIRVNAFSQEHTYDSNSNLSSDSNKEITSIHYNHLNLADTIHYADGRKMIYTYTASGQKLREQSILANGTIKQKRDYSGTILYRNDSLQEIKHEDGRIIPGDVAEYQYHLTDHLGNVRTTLTSNQEVDNSTATYETENAATEQNKYLRYTVARRVNAPVFDHTHSGTTFYSERLSGSANEKYGIARSLSVMPGDTIKLEVFAKYVDPNSSNWTQALTTLLTQITAGTASVGTVVDGANYATNGTTPFPFAGLNNTANSTGAGPRAYLNWLIFDRNFVLKTGGYVKMTNAAKENGSNVPHERLSTEFITKEAGYVYVYLSNEETTPREVYFDDLSVTQVKGPIVQESDYDPFGLTFNEHARENATQNNFLYNGKELQSDFELNWYDYGARMYDAALGRWHVIDPMAEKYVSYSPYNYTFNNPLKFVDPDGRDAELVIDHKNKTATVQANYYVYPHETDKALDGLHVWSEMSGKNKIQVDGQQYVLNFSFTVLVVKGGDPEELSKMDPIGNTLNVLSVGVPLVRSGSRTVLSGSTVGSKNITVPSDASATDIAHEIGHTLLGLGGDERHKEHVSNTVMDESSIDVKRKINQEVVNKIRQTYRLIKNDHPTKPYRATIIKATNEEVIRYLGENFRSVLQPDISDRDLRKHFFDLQFKYKP